MKLREGNVLNLSVSLFTGGVSQHAMGRADTPSQTPPPTPGQTPARQTPPRKTPSRQTPYKMATETASKHPTGMHSCYGLQPQLISYDASIDADAPN